MASKKISVLGSGLVGEVLANGFLKHGYEVLRASREPEKLQSWKDTSGLKASIGTLQDGAKFGDIIVLVVKGTAAESAIEQAGLENLRGKVIIDATNPIEDTPPVNGVLSFFTGPNDSLMERLQRLAPEAHFVKAFSCVGSGFMVNPQFPGGPPTMFICGNNAQAKEVVKEILSQFGWETEDMGLVESARGIEPLCILWCNRGFSGNGWAHAFKLLKL